MAFLGGCTKRTYACDSVDFLSQEASSFFLLLRCFEKRILSETNVIITIFKLVSLDSRVMTSSYNLQASGVQCFPALNSNML